MKAGFLSKFLSYASSQVAQNQDGVLTELFGDLNSMILTPFTTGLPIKIGTD